MIVRYGVSSVNSLDIGTLVVFSSHQRRILKLSNEGPCFLYIIIAPRHEICNNVVCATRKASDQPAHTCSLI